MDWPALISFKRSFTDPVPKEREERFAAEGIDAFHGHAASAGPPLTPVANSDAEVAAADMINGNHKIADYSGVPSIAFTVPPIARVGLLEEEARKKPPASHQAGEDVRLVHGPARGRGLRWV